MQQAGPAAPESPGATGAPRPSGAPVYPLIEDYALIGDMQSAALVSREGSIDWLCLPRFDSDAVFAAIVGESHNGQWRLNPTVQEGPPSRAGQVERKYRDDTLILETQWTTVGGVVKVIDFMPQRGDDTPVLIRIVEGVSGAVEMEKRDHDALRLRPGRALGAPGQRRDLGGRRPRLGLDQDPRQAGRARVGAPRGLRGPGRRAGALHADLAALAPAWRAARGQCR